MQIRDHGNNHSERNYDEHAGAASVHGTGGEMPGAAEMRTAVERERRVDKRQ